MISRLRGNIIEKKPPLVLIEVHGVGYEVNMPMSCFYHLPEINQEIIIFVHSLVRDDINLLFGFNNKQERELFREMIKVKGIGPKIALSILSNISAQQFITAVEYEDIELIIKLPGIGKKTAERLMVEMKGHFKYIHNSQYMQVSNEYLTTPSSRSKDYDAEKEAIAALLSLGFKLHDANQRIQKVRKPDTDCKTLIRKALCVSFD